MGLGICIKCCIPVQELHYVDIISAIINGHNNISRCLPKWTTQDGCQKSLNRSNDLYMVEFDLDGRGINQNVALLFRNWIKTLTMAAKTKMAAQNGLTGIHRLNKLCMFVHLLPTLSATKLPSCSAAGISRCWNGWGFPGLLHLFASDSCRTVHLNLLSPTLACLNCHYLSNRTAKRTC